MNEPKNTKAPQWGKIVLSIGLGMIAVSIVLVFLGISGAVLHNVLQLGGIAVAVVGFILWKVVKV
ncbi:hypothetical protein H6F50_08245 [Coleofasciculus sp. FACHB-712]|uniref:hypothetical protein n=1 Tax=Coleofasciculus sp. FACHB-712 TaxID=2692789 RepID=UPI001682D401|nr:hypothetical protein [Coleofasciculus sp. FACHB-712]MBD1942345.1 hypothetical protein [Coleofasciculus sp. FACHB-712]